MRALPAAARTERLGVRRRERLVSPGAFVVAKRWHVGIVVLVGIAWAHRGRASGMVVELKLREPQVPGNRVSPDLGIHLRRLGMAQWPSYLPGSDNQLRWPVVPFALPSLPELLEHEDYFTRFIDWTLLRRQPYLV